jgi:hypothetical protein
VVGGLAVCWSHQRRAAVMDGWRLPPSLMSPVWCRQGGGGGALHRRWSASCVSIPRWGLSAAALAISGVWRVCSMGGDGGGQASQICRGGGGSLLGVGPERLLCSN